MELSPTTMNAEDHDTSYDINSTIPSRMSSTNCNIRSDDDDDDAADDAVVAAAHGEQTVEMNQNLNDRDSHQIPSHLIIQFSTALDHDNDHPFDTDTHEAISTIHDENDFIHSRQQTRHNNNNNNGHMHHGNGGNHCNHDHDGDDESDYRLFDSSERRQKIAQLEAERMAMEREWELCTRDPYKASPGSAYPRYGLAVDHAEGDRATEINLRSFQRPHMRALHCAWIAFCLAFMIWFAPAPILPEIRKTLSLSQAEVWNAAITNDCVAVFMRLLIGPICDAYGARIPMAAVLIAASIPCACVGFIQSGTGLAVIRFFIGIAGSSFVMAQFWPSRMFAREVSGTSNGIVAGWGNLGTSNLHPLYTSSISLCIH
jgi:hypothetical protein